MCKKLQRCKKCRSIKIEQNGVEVWVTAVAPGHSTLEEVVCPHCEQDEVDQEG
jgi:hypothetical protein